jgi:hypothetical protein
LWLVTEPTFMFGPTSRSENAECAREALGTGARLGRKVMSVRVLVPTALVPEL